MTTSTLACIVPPLEWAAQCGQEATTQKLMDARVGPTNNTGLALVSAGKYGHSKVTGLLLSHGFDPNEKHACHRHRCTMHSCMVIARSPMLSLKLVQRGS